MADISKKILNLHVFTNILMKTIYLVDYLGTHGGMDYYLDAFKKALGDIPGWEVKFLSNFAEKEGEEPFFLNQYSHNIWKKAWSVYSNYGRLGKFINHHSNDVFIYLSHGNPIDIKFIKFISQAPNHIIDIHEAIALNMEGNPRLRHNFAMVYSQNVNAVISHSQRTEDFLDDYDFVGYRFRVPHFRYAIPKEYDITKVAEDIRNAIDPERKNVLFFGNLNESKGIDILMRAINQLDESVAAKYNFIIAGKDFDGAVDIVKINPGRKAHIFARHINDDELRFLFVNSDFLAMPYRKTSQSGILEMALYFKKPVIASSVEYFKQRLEDYPSFGVLAGKDDKSYAKALTNLADCDITGFYKNEDYERFEKHKEISAFREKFIKWLES